MLTIPEFRQMHDMCLESADALIAHEGSKVALEGALFSLMDTTLRYFMNIRNALSGGDFRRSELRMFKERHLMALRSLMGKKSMDLTMTVDIPEYMISAYKPAVTSVLDLIKAVDITAVVKDLVTVCELVQFHEDADTKAMVTALKAYAAKRLTYTRTMVLSATKPVFSEKGTHVGFGAHKRVAIASDVMGSPDDIRDVFEKLMGAESIYRDTIELQHTELPAAEKAVRMLIDRIGKAERDGSSAKVSSLRDYLYTCLRGFAEVVDGYGVLVQMLQVLEHNFTLALTPVMAKNT